jgi:hypothetical protein
MTFDRERARREQKIREQLKLLSERHRVLMDSLLFGDFSRAEEVASVQEKISGLLERIIRTRKAEE